MTQQERYRNVIDWFSQNMPDASTELHFKNPFQLLISVILSAQCTDKRVNMITPALFKEYPTPEDMAVTSQEKIFSYIKSCSYPNNKAKNLLGMAKGLTEHYRGIVPDTREALMTLPGVGRKTANVMLICAFDKPAMPVDTHVFRVANRIGLTQKAKTTAETEKTLMKYFPENLLGKAHHWLILHGRYTCKARNPLCEKCGIQSCCDYYQNNCNAPQKK